MKAQKEAVFSDNYRGFTRRHAVRCARGRI